MNQSEILAVACNLLKAREKLRVQGAIGFVLASHWWKNWCVILKPISKHSNRNHLMTFGSHLKTALRRTFELGLITMRLKLSDRCAYSYQMKMRKSWW